MLKPKVESILVEQIGKEIYSSNLYLSMASWADRNGLEEQQTGFMLRRKKKKYIC